MPGPCRHHGTFYSDNCDACILWSVEVHRLMTALIADANVTLKVNDWPTF